jgi:hypothetical protein
VFDAVGIVFSSVMIFIIIFRALQLDGSQPWFEPPPQEPAPATEAVSAQDERRPVRPGRIRPAWVARVRSRGASR